MVDEAAEFTISDIVPELAMKFESPKYSLVIVWVPGASAVVRDAAPFTSATVPSDVDPSKNWTDPIGVPAPGATAATVAV
jgi:hypothetical protein